jgi:exopolysaccharide production protein ExoZ
VILTAHWNDIGKPSTLVPFLWKRFRRIYPLYWVFFLLTVFSHLAGAGSDSTYQRDPWVLLSGFTLLHLFSVDSNMVVAWSLFDEVMFYICFSIVLLNKRMGVVILALWMAASLFFIFPSNSYWSVLFSANHLLFGLGMLLAWRLRKDDRLADKPVFWPVFWLGAVIFLVCIVLVGPLSQREMPIRLAAGTGAACAFFGAAIAEQRGVSKIPNWLVFLGDASYSIYLAHFMVISAVARACFRHWGALPIPAAFWMIFLSVCGTAVGILVHLFVERPLLSRLGKRVQRA